MRRGAFASAVMRLIERQLRPRGAGEEDTDGGWTFVEILIVMAIILILSGTVGFIAVRYVENAREVAARSQIESLDRFV